jgi:hypothetical protein
MNGVIAPSAAIVITMLGSSASPSDDVTQAIPPAATASSHVEPSHVELQPWQARRAEFHKIVDRLHQGDPLAARDFDAVLTEFDTHVFSRTPIEELEILGVFYIPKQGLDPALLVVVQNLVLGWYDALRFGSESARAEITNNEGFFKKAFALGGPDVASKATKFIEGNPDRVRHLVAQGISIAEKYRETKSYDRHWPTAYGLERFICASGGPCEAPPEMPSAQWDEAWEESKRRVTVYFQPAVPK